MLDHSLIKGQDGNWGLDSWSDFDLQLGFLAEKLRDIWLD